jgi:hypothetical protein
MNKRQLLVLIGVLCPTFAQNGAIPITMGYLEPAPFQAAPGQVVTLFLDNIPQDAGGVPRSAQAAAGDLPTNLAGISVRIIQSDGSEVLAPIFSVRQQLACGLSGLIAGDAACVLTLIKVQIPFELQGDLVRRDEKSYSYALPALVSIDVDGRRGRGFALQPLPDDTHVLTTCDATWDTHGTSICDRQAYHSGGSVVSPNAPAQVGEVLYVLAYGLGKPNPAVATGQASPEGATVTDLIPGYPRVTLGMVTNFVNVVSSGPRTSFNPQAANAARADITSASLLPGQTGIYQLSFVVPVPKDSVIPCGDEVRSNSLLLVTTSQGVEGIGLCVVYASQRKESDRR